MTPANPLEPLLARRLVVVTGKGGVGKTVIAAVLGRLLANAGRRALLLEMDPRESLHQLLGVPPSGGEVVPIGGGLSLENVQPRSVLDRIVEEHVRLGFVARRVLASPLYAELAQGMPGLKELAVLHHAFTATGGGERSRGERAFDVVVLDAPATGHGLALLAAPRITTDAIATGPVAEVAGELARFVEDPATTSVVTVTRAEEMPVEETLDLAAALAAQRGSGPELLVVNGLYPPLPASGRPLPPALALWGERRRLNERELARLAERWPGPRRTLPLLAIDRGPALVAELARRLAEGEL